MKEFINKNKDYIIIGTVSLIAFIIGCLAINFWVSLIIIGLADIILFIPNLMKNRKKVEKGRHAALNKKKTKPKKVKPEKKEKKKKKVWKKLLFIFLILCIFAILAFCAFWAYIVANAPKFKPEELYHQEASTLFDKDGKEFAKLGAENREIISYDDLPEVLIDAIVATEY